MVYRNNALYIADQKRVKCDLTGKGSANDSPNIEFVNDQKNNVYV